MRASVALLLLTSLPGCLWGYYAGEVCYEGACADLDGDGYGDPDACMSVCDGDSAPADTTSIEGATDCNDADPDVFPGAPEICNGADDDCDGVLDDADADIDTATMSRWYPDADGDTHGSQVDPGVLACAGPPGAVQSNDDCDDTDGAAHPGALEVCDDDDVDEDCDGFVDDMDVDVDPDSLLSWYVDADRDDFGDDADDVVLSCAKPTDHVDTPGDCDDADAAVNPDATEICRDGIDNDCDGGVNGCEPFAAAITSDDAGAHIGPDAYDAARALSGCALEPGVDGFVLGAPHGNDNGYGEVQIYSRITRGSSPTRSDAQAVLIGGTDGDVQYLGQRVACLGDATGDEYADVAALAGGVVVAFHGPFEGNASAFEVFDQTFTDENLDSDGQLTGGDFDGDGRAELVVGIPDAGDSDGLVRWLSDVADASSGPLSDATGGAIIGGALGGRFGDAVQRIGDINGDGVAELAVGAPDAIVSATSSGVVYVFDLTEAEESTVVADAILVVRGESLGSALGDEIGGVGDFDGDGLGDVLIAAPDEADRPPRGSGVVYVVTAASGVVEGASAHLIVSEDEDGESFGERLDFAGDVDADGRDDLILGATQLTAGGGGAVLFYGSAAPTIIGRGSADVQISPAGVIGTFGKDVLGGYDFDGDGNDDFLVGRESVGDLYVFFGGAL